MPEPTIVITLNILKSIRTNPAGIEMRWRTTGNNRAKNTPLASYRASHRSESSSFCGLRKKNLPNLMIKGRPTNRDTQYVTAAPRYDPTVPARITPAKLNFPCAARKAAGGITISLGTGKIELSIAIKMMIPA